MRKVTILRRKSFVGCVGKLQLYVEDQINGDLDVCGYKCSKLGVLKNGEQKTFEIGNEETKIFAFWDKSSRNFSNNLYIVPSEFTPLICSTSTLVIFGLYAIIDNVSIAAVDRLGFALLSKIGYI